MSTKTADAIILAMLVLFFFGAITAARMYESKAGASVPAGPSTKFVPIKDTK